ncbi:MAG TPA: aminodeoxychorismate synthase component I [Chthoniobacteraceae bacterium]|nr:aminodeoxychorismate synthase component I [Chthoniobacteraceae bacterium]
MPLLVRAPRPVALDLSPVEVAARCRHLPGLVFFDTARDSGDGGDLSIVAARPVEVIRGDLHSSSPRLRQALAARATSGGADDGLPQGFAAGFVEYDGAFCFGLFEDALIFRHADQSWHELGELRPLLREPPRMHAEHAPEFRPHVSRERFCAMVARAQEYIAAGDIYQVNLAHRFSAPWLGDPFAFYEALRHYSPAPFAAFVDLGGRCVLSSSPESFLKMSGRAIRTRPIKGTRPRRADATADEKSAYDLITSPKEVAELVMITDLERNDLGQVCDFGSVSVPELLRLERHEQVFHLVSTVEGRLRRDIDHLAALRACFPGGSITGAPKRRARQIIAELESEPRGLYTGAIGWLGFNGESHFNIAIRTVVIKDGVAHFHVGAGIVADSIPEREWQETLDKAAGILLAAERLEGMTNE